VGSIKSKLVMGYSVLAIAAVLAAGAVIVVSRHRMLHAELEEQGEAFARLAAPQLSAIHDTYYLTGYQKFVELTRRILEDSRDLRRYTLFSVDGTALFDAPALEEPVFIQQARPLGRAEPGEMPLLQAIAPATRKAGGAFVVYLPVVETWGQHRNTARFEFDYRRIHHSLLWVGVFTLLGMSAAVGLILVVTPPLAERIAAPLRDLADRADRLARGEPVHALPEERTDEIGSLIRSFNDMALQISIQLVGLRAANEDLEKAYAELRTLDRMKDELVANVSHELRTPLTTAKGYTEHLLHGMTGFGPSREELARSLGVIQKNLDRLQGLIEGLIDLSLLQREAFPVTPEVFDPADLLQTLRENYAGQELPGGVRLSVASHLSAGSRVSGDRDRLLQVLENLVTNSIKFNRLDGRVEVSLEPEGDRAVFAVADTGVGIPAEALGHVFERFYQVDGSARRKHGGMGLGLSIASAIIRAHGGELRVESRLHEGSRFWFSLPLVQEADRPLEGRPTVLVVEDNRPLRQMMADRLERHGFSVLQAATLEAMRAHLGRERVDVVSLDLLLDGRRADEAVGALQAGGLLATIPLVVVSVVPVAECALRTAAFLEKPVSMEKLAHVLERIVKGGAHGAQDPGH
jgi:signal transduction histidine kinase